VKKIAEKEQELQSATEEMKNEKVSSLILWFNYTYMVCLLRQPESVKYWSSIFMNWNSPLYTWQKILF
jgi:hypothetical protein